MLEEEIKRLTVAVLDLTAAIKSMLVQAEAEERIPVNMPFDRVPTTGVTPAPSPAAAKAYADVAKEVEAHAEAIAPYVAQEYTADDARKALMALAAAKGKDAAKAVLKQFSASKIPDLAPQHWPEFIAACKAALS